MRAEQNQTNIAEGNTSVEMSDMSNMLFHHHCPYPNLGTHLHA